jgi:imidazolonepropionase-like amidohydrolase
VLAGLIDRHVHLIQDQQANDGRAALAGLNYALKDLHAGFTTLQDMGSGFSYATVELRDAINKGLVPGLGCRCLGRSSTRAARLTTRSFGGDPVRAGTGNQQFSEHGEHQFTVAGAGGRA